jgi:hypothetical protein
MSGFLCPAGSKSAASCGVLIGLVRGRGYAQVGQEPEHVVVAVVQAFRQQPAGWLFHAGAGDPRDLGQSDPDAVPEQPQVRGLGVVRYGGQARVAGEVRGGIRARRASAIWLGQIAAG